MFSLAPLGASVAPARIEAPHFEMVSRPERAARNEALFREVNERIRDVSARFEVSHGEFVCECSDGGCTQTLTMTLDEYEAVRSRGDRFAVVAGHEDLAIERVVERKDRFTVVEKIGESAAIAERENPRTKGRDRAVRPGSV